MSDWTLKRAASQPNCAVSDGSVIYYRENTSEDIYKYDPSDNSLTLIIDKSVHIGSLIGDSISSLAWFNDDLYLAVTDRFGSNIDKQVRRWNGSLNDTTTVHTIISGGYSGLLSLPILFTTSTNIIVVDTWVLSSVRYTESHYSADASSWTTSSPGWDTYPDNTILTSTNRRNSSFPSDRVFARYREFPSLNYMIYQYNESTHTWNLVKYNYVLGEFGQSAPTEATEHWIDSSDKFTEDWISSTTIATARWTYQVNMPYSIGIDNSTFDKIYEFNGATWDLLDTLSTLTLVGSNAVCVRMNDGEVYLIAYDGGSWDIYQRDEPIPIVTGDRVWTYKTENAGNSWISRGVTT